MARDRDRSSIKIKDKDRIDCDECKKKDLYTLWQCGICKSVYCYDCATKVVTSCRCRYPGGMITEYKKLEVVKE